MIKYVKSEHPLILLYISVKRDTYRVERRLNITTGLPIDYVMNAFEVFLEHAMLSRSRVNDCPTPAFPLVIHLV